MVIKMTVSFDNLFLAVSRPKKLLVWKRYIADVFSLWNINMGKISSIEQANRHHPAITVETLIRQRNHFHTRHLRLQRRPRP